MLHTDLNILYIVSDIRNNLVLKMLNKVSNQILFSRHEMLDTNTYMLKEPYVYNCAFEK